MAQCCYNPHYYVISLYQIKTNHTKIVYKKIYLPWWSVPMKYVWYECSKRGRENQISDVPHMCEHTGVIRTKISYNVCGCITCMYKRQQKNIHNPLLLQSVQWWKIATDVAVQLNAFTEEENSKRFLRCWCSLHLKDAHPSLIPWLQYKNIIHDINIL